MQWQQFFEQTISTSRTRLRRIASDFLLLTDTSQLNRRSRIAWRRGRVNRALYLIADHQRRRITRRRAIRKLIEG